MVLVGKVFQEDLLRDAVELGAVRELDLLY
jgi:hypothetical protein